MFADDYDYECGSDDIDDLFDDYDYDNIQEPNHYEYYYHNITDELTDE